MSKFWELVGIVIGDGNIVANNGHWWIEITGDINKDHDYLSQNVKGILETLTKEKVRIGPRSNALRVRTISRPLIRRLMNIGMHAGYTKLDHLGFLYKLNNAQRKAVLRGLMDTDGSVIERSNRQVFMEISTCSKFLAVWINSTLKILGFRPFITKARNKLGGNLIYRVWLSGRGNIRRWTKVIGFSNKYKLEKALEILSRGV